MTQQEIDEKLLSAADPAYREFNARIVRTALPMIGVRAPVLKALAKELARAPREFLDTYVAENYEQILLYGLTLGKAKLPFADKCAYLRRIVPKFDNWAHVDMVASACKDMGKAQDTFFASFADWRRGGEFERRFLIVYAMDYCMTAERLPFVFDLYADVQCDAYYVQMGIAWGLSVALVHFYDETVAKLQSGIYDPWIVRKAAQKARESFRVPPARKDELKALFMH